jgi:hypothetical protein
LFLFNIGERIVSSYFDFLNIFGKSIRESEVGRMGLGGGDKEGNISVLKGIVQAFPLCPK